MPIPSYWKKFSKVRTLKKLSSCWVPVRVVPVAQKRRMAPHSKRQLQKDSSQPQKNLLDSSPGEGFSVVRRQRIVDYQCQSRIRLFWWGDYRKKGYNHENLSRVFVPVKMVSAAWKRSTIIEQGQDQWLACDKLWARKTVMLSSLCLWCERAHLI
jgi:hypothetical protein